MSIEELLAEIEHISYVEKVGFSSTKIRVINEEDWQKLKEEVKWAKK